VRNRENKFFYLSLFHVVPPHILWLTCQLQRNSVLIHYLLYSLFLINCLKNFHFFFVTHQDYLKSIDLMIQNYKNYLVFYYYIYVLFFFINYFITFCIFQYFFH